MNQNPFIDFDPKVFCGLIKGLNQLDSQGQKLPKKD